jgi:hypothetical protein
MTRVWLPPTVIAVAALLLVCRELGRLLRVNVMGFDYTGKYVLGEVSSGVGFGRGSIRCGL